MVTLLCGVAWSQTEPSEPSVFTDTPPSVEVVQDIPFTFDPQMSSVNEEGNNQEPSSFAESQTEMPLLLTEENSTSPKINASPFEPDAKALFLSVENIPSRIAVGQIFPVKIKAIIAVQNFDEIVSNFEDLPDVEVLNPNAKWQWFSDNIFYNTFYMRVTHKTTQLPTMSVHVSNGFEIIQEDELLLEAPNTIELNGDEQYSHVIAESLEVKKFKTSRFDDKNLIMVMEIDATYANLDEFKLSGMIKEGIDSSSKEFPYHKIYYFAIFEDYTKVIHFTYFNVSQNQFKRITLPVTIDEDDVSTQSDLNPKENQFIFYKNIATVACVFLLIVLFFYKRKIIYLFLAIVLGAYFVYDKNPLSTLKIKGEIKVRILPTEKSTIFYVTDRILYVEKLGSRDTYIKILLPNGKIGWIKEEDVLKD